jgi:thymidylate kinase
VKKSPLIFEFAGLPGAGKSTIARALVDDLKKTEFKYYFHFSSQARHQSEIPKYQKKLMTFYNLLYAIVRYPRVAFNASIYVLKTKPFNLKRFQRVSKLLLKLNRTKKLISEEHDIIVLDQGIIQNIWSLAAIGNLPKEKYISRILKSTVDVLKIIFIYVEVDVETAIKRINLRMSSDSRFDKFASSDSLLILENQNNFFEHVMSKSDHIEGLAYLAISGNDPIDKNINIIERFIEQCLNDFQSNVESKVPALNF